MVKVGGTAPAFSLPSTAGGKQSLKDLRGGKVVLYFYPRDSTPGCTTEACDFRDSMARLKRKGVTVLGVSKDSLESHEKFRGKYKLRFDLLTDVDNKVATKYGAFGEKLMYGKKVQGTIRSTFLIDEAGKLEAIWSPVRVKGHVDKVLEVLAGGAAPVKPVAKRKVAKKKAAVKRNTATKASATKRKAAKKTVAKKGRMKTAKRKAAK